MANFHFFRSGRAKDLSAPLCVYVMYVCLCVCVCACVCMYIYIYIIRLILDHIFYVVSVYDFAVKYETLYSSLQLYVYITTL